MYLLECFSDKDIKTNILDFHHDSVVENLPAHAGDTGLILGPRNKIPRATGKQPRVTATELML